MERQAPNSTHSKHGQKSAEPQQPVAADGVVFSSDESSDTERADQLRVTPAMLLVPLLVLGTLIAFGAVPRYLQHQALVKEKEQQLAKAPSVPYVLVQASPAVQEFVLPGSTEAILTAPVYARVDGYLHLRNVNIGDTVHKGQVLAEIETPELDKQVQTADNSVQQANANLNNAQEALKKAQADQRSSEANVNKAKTDADFAHIEYLRYEQLAKTGAVSAEQRDSKLTDYKAALATYEASQESARSAAAQVRVAMSAVKAAQAAIKVSESTRDQYATTRGFREVTANFDGVVTQRNVDPGALITSGSTAANTVLFTIGKIDTLRIYAYVPEQYISLVHVGQTAQLSFEAFPNERFAGTVTYVAGGLDPQSRTLQVEIHIPNIDHRLMPGMFAQVHFQAPSKVRLAIVPASAVRFLADGCFVYTIDNDNRVRIHKAEIARDLGGKLEVVSGIKIGDKVIVSAGDEVVEGARVNPVSVTQADADSSKQQAGHGK